MDPYELETTREGQIALLPPCLYRPPVMRQVSCVDGFVAYRPLFIRDLAHCPVALLSKIGLRIIRVALCVSKRNVGL